MNVDEEEEQQSLSESATCTQSQIQVVKDNGGGCDSDDSISVDTHDAFMDMLGLTHDIGDDIIDDDDNDTKDLNYSGCDETNNELQTESPSSSKVRLQPGTLPYDTIPLPPRCSRLLLPPSECLAIVIDNVLTEIQCQYLIQKAHHNCGNGNGFRYITEASHKAPDGSTYKVQIQNPNPHKLAVIDTCHDPLLSSASVSASNKNRFKGHEDHEATKIMDHLYSMIQNVLDDSNNINYQTFLSRTNCGLHEGLNPRMRILKYDAENNDRFEAHFDATTFVSNPNSNKNAKTSTSTSTNHTSSENNKNQQQSLITVLVYLNNGDGEDFDGGETIYLDYHNSLSRTTSVNRRSSNSSGNDIKVTPKIGRVVLFEHDLFHSGSPLQWGTKYIMRTDILFQEQNLVQNKDDGSNNSLSNINDVGEDKKDDDDDDSTNGHTNEEVLLIKNICDDINLSSDDVQILDDMDLLHVTPHAFISPGVTLLKQMLVDAGIQDEVVVKLFQKAFALTRN